MITYIYFNNQIFFILMTLFIKPTSTYHENANNINHLFNSSHSLFSLINSLLTFLIYLSFFTLLSIYIVIIYSIFLVSCLCLCFLFLCLMCILLSCFYSKLNYIYFLCSFYNLLLSPVKIYFLSNLLYWFCHLRAVLSFLYLFFII